MLALFPVGTAPTPVPIPEVRLAEREAGEGEGEDEKKGEERGASSNVDDGSHFKRSLMKAWSVYMS